MPDSFDRSARQALLQIAGPADGSYRHLSQWKAKRGTAWKERPYVPGVARRNPCLDGHTPSSICIHAVLLVVGEFTE